MNYKLLFPSYRTRYRFVEKNLKNLPKNAKVNLALNVGTGEGDYDPMIAGYCEQLNSCDLSASDIEFAKQLNVDCSNILYEVQDALNLDYNNQTFDLVISVDVIEHVPDSPRMIEEIARVLKPNAYCIISFPSLHFPFTYDPVNRTLSLLNKRLSFGAYGFGHFKLIKPEAFKKWIEPYFDIIEEQKLTGYLAGLSEMYWPGLAQKLLKSNANNLPEEEAKKMTLRPSRKEPALTKVTDMFINLDSALFAKSKYSVGRGYLLKRK